MADPDKKEVKASEGMVFSAPPTSTAPSGESTVPPAPAPSKEGMTFGVSAAPATGEAGTTLSSEDKAAAKAAEIGGRPSEGRIPGTDIKITPGGVTGARHGTMVHGPLSNAPDDTWLDSIWKGGVTAGTRAIMMPVGFYGDLRDITHYGFDRAMAAIQGIPYEERVRRNKETRESGEKNLPAWQKVVPDVVGNLPTTAELSDEALRQSGLGRYDPTSMVGKIAQGTTEAFLGGGGLTGLTGTKISPNATIISSSSPVPAQVMKLGDKATYPAGTVGAASTAATEVTGDPLVGLAAGVPVGIAHGKIADASKLDIPSGGKLVADTATNPEAVARFRRDPNELAPTTAGTATGDTGLIVAEKQIAATDTPFKDKQKQILEAENKARVLAIQDLGDPNVNPKDLADYLVTRRDALTAEHDAKVAVAEARQQAAVGPDGKPIEDIGAKAHSEGVALAEKSRNERDALYDAVDPDGKLHAVADDMITSAEKLRGTRDPHIPEDKFFSPYVTTVMDEIQKLPRVVPFQTLKNYDVWVGNQIKMAEKAGDMNAARQLGELQKGIDKSMTNVLENQVKWELGQVKAGNMKMEDTIGARFKADAENFIARRQGEKSGAVATIAGVESAQPTPNLDPAAVRRYEDAKQAHKIHAEIFQEGVVGEALAKNGYQDKRTAAQVASSIFTPGDEGATNLNAWMRAAQTSDNPGAIHGIAVDTATTRLREMLGPDGVVTPEILAKWKQRYAPALRTMDEHIPGFSQRFNNAAAATQALGDAMAARTTAVENFQKSQAGKLAGVTTDDEVINLVGKLINSDTGPTQLAALMDTAKSPQEIAGIQVAARDYLLRTTANAGMAGGENLMSGAKTSDLVRKRSDALRKIFGAKGFENIQSVIDSMERSAEATTKAAEAGSDTVTKLQPVIADVKKPIPSVMPPPTAATVRDFIWSGSLGTGLEIAGNIRERMRLKGIRNAYDSFKAAMLDPELAAVLAQQGLDERGQPNAAALSKVVTMLQAHQAADAITPHETKEREYRRGRAAGGRTLFKLDCAAKASKLCREAEKIRKRHGGETKKFLDVHDDRIADALRVASRGL